MISMISKSSSSPLGVNGFSPEALSFQDKELPIGNHGMLLCSSVTVLWEFFTQKDGMPSGSILVFVGFWQFNLRYVGQNSFPAEIPGWTHFTKSWNSLNS